MKTLFITGVSSGLCRAIAEAALADGHRVVGTVRNEGDARTFEALTPGRAVAQLLDVTDDSAVLRAVSHVESTIAPIDVLVSSAGYGHEGIIEESSMSDLRRQFDVNVFGAVAVIKAVLPFMRGQRSGRILVVTSMAAFITLPGLAFYHGSKAALEGIVGSLRKEVAQFGIHVTAVAPGGFRTEWAGRSMVRAPRSIPDYDALFDPQRANRQQRSGKQLGDPAKLARVTLELLDDPEPPAHLVLGSDARRLIDAERQVFDNEVRAWDSVSRSTDIPDGAQIT